MQDVNLKKLNRSISMYPIFYGLSSDLIFFIAINTLFLTTVKGLSASTINQIEAISTIIGIFFQFILIKIVRKIGNQNSVRLGVVLLLFSVLLNTFSTNYYGFLFAEIFYTIGFVFKNMDNVILIKNLKYLNKSDEYIKYQTKGSFIYSLLTLLISIVSGFLFNINPYVPMAICILFCFINIILANFIYEVPINKSSTAKKEKLNINFTKNTILMLLLYGVFYAMVSCGQKNSKIFLQFDLQNLFSLDKVAIYIGILIFISRIFRLSSNLLFFKIYNKLKNKMIFLLESILILAFIFLIIGHFIDNIYGIFIMAFGFFLFLFIRDPFDNFMRKNLLEKNNEYSHDKIINYINLSRKVFTLIYTTIASLILMKFNYVHVMSLFLIISMSFMILIIKSNITKN